MHGYSDRVSHALAFSAKYYNSRVPKSAWMAYLAQPANVALILARYGADEATVVSGILHHSLEETAHDHECAMLRRKIADKFGPIILGVVLDAVEPRFDGRGGERPWRACKQEFLVHLAEAEPRALDICVADEIQRCGWTGTMMRRLGVEYLRTVSHASVDQTMWWYRSMIEVLAGRDEWPRRAMLEELRMMSAGLIRDLRNNEEGA